MEISNVLSRAWQTIWKHKILWIFGILAGCSSASTSGSGGSGYRFSSNDFNSIYINLSDAQWAAIIAAVLCLTLIFFFLVIFLGTIGRIGLVRGTQLVEDGREKLNFGELFSESMPFFWRVFGLSLLIAVVAFIGVFFIGLPLSIFTCGIGAIALFLALLMLPVLIELSVIAIVVDDLSVLDGLKRGWDVFVHNLGTMILMWLILTFGFWLVTFIIAGIPAALFLAPVAAMTNTGIIPANDVKNIISAICIVAFIPVILVIIGILRSFVTSAWTHTYLELTGQASMPTPPLPPEVPQAPQPPEPEESVPDPI